MADNQTTVVVPKPFEALRIDHVGMVVRDISEATRFYAAELGLVAIGDPLELKGRDTLVQFLGVGEDRLELLMPTTASGTLARFLNKRGEGLHHLCFIVGDIHGAVTRLSDRGITMVDTEPWRSPHGWAAYIHPASAHGCAIELREHF